jgi:hypothetical protein
MMTWRFFRLATENERELLSLGGGSRVETPEKQY